MNYKRLTAVLMASAFAASALTLGGCGSSIDSDAVVATVGGEEITLGYANFAAQYMHAYYDSIFITYYGEDYWTSSSYTDDDGNTMEDTVKDSVMEDIELTYLLAAEMETYGVEITEDELAAMEEAAAEFMEENSSEAIAAMGATQEIVAQYLYYQTVGEKMYDAIIATADTDVSDEECAQRTFSYVFISTEGYYDDDYNYVEYTDDELEELAEEAAEFAAAALEDFDTAVDDYGLSSYTYSYGADEDSEEDGGFSEIALEAADALSEGEVSALIEVDDGYYVLRLDSEYDEDATEEAREDIISERQSEKYTEVVEALQEASDFELDEDLWAQVTFSDLFTVVEDEEETSTDE